MRHISQLKRKLNKLSAKQEPYTLYTYILDDGSEVDSLQEYPIGQRVEVWYDEEWNKSKLRPYKGLTNE